MKKNKIGNTRRFKMVIITIIRISICMIKKDNKLIIKKKLIIKMNINNENKKQQISNKWHIKVFLKYLEQS